MADLNQLLQRLCDAEINFVVVGGFAGVLHGSTLVTRDLDICAILTPDTIEKLRTILADLQPVHRTTTQRLSFLSESAPRADVRNLYLETDAGAIDFLGSITGVGDFERVRAGSIEIELFGRRCLVISLEDLIAAKLALGRDKDLLAARELALISEQLRNRTT